MCKISTSHLLNTSAVSVHPFNTCHAGYSGDMTMLNNSWVFLYRFSWGSGHSANGASGEVNNDSLAQMGFLPWQLWWWTEGLSSPEKDTVTTCLCWFWSMFMIWSTTWHRFLLCSSLNWVTPQMLSVPFPNKKTAVTGDPFLPAITGEQSLSCL